MVSSANVADGRAIDDASRCPCDSGRRHGACCGPCHAGTPAADAEALMRSRYSAYVLQRADYLLASWHPSTRPQALSFDDAPTWIGLQLRRHHVIDATHAEVEFIARFRVGGGSARRMHERSRFVHEDGRWYYVDGEML
jgi:SEC-C motif-containing protein